MRNIVSLCAAVLAFASPSLVQAADQFGPANGTYTFAGPVTVQKNLTPPTACNLALSIVVSGVGTPGNAANVTAAPVFTGGPICAAISFSNLSYSVDAVGAGGPGSAADELLFSTVRVNIPPVGGTPPAACQSVLRAYWLGNGPPTPREIEFDSPFSDMLAVLGGPAPCKIIGTLTQTSGPSGANLDITI